jgi:aspartyl-tRNA(Asn)/glutamyl-tRNA(Gln) amidotransferase subunit C
MTMVKIDDALLARLQNLCMLQIPQEHSHEAKEQLNKFLEFVDILDELDLESVKPSYGAVDMQAPLRTDTPCHDPSIPSIVLAHAPKATEDFFIVPKIID